MLNHGVTHFTPDSCFGCKVKTVQISQTPFQPHYNWAVGKYVNTKQEFLDALSRCSDQNSEITGTDHRYEARLPGDTEPIREADGVLDTTAKNVKALELGKSIPTTSSNLVTAND